VRVADLPPGELRGRLARGTLTLELGPFRARVRSRLASLHGLAADLYPDYPVAPPEALADFHVRVDRVRSLTSPLRPTVGFWIDGRQRFPPSPVEHALPILEWGLNWCVADRAHHLLMLHAAVVERGGRALILPAWPGHGKSTLCTALVFSGWRLLSDEFGLVRPRDGALLALPRLIPLKNESIEVIRGFAPGAHLGPSFFGTRKGTVAHVRPPRESIERSAETARPAWLVFPRWVAGAPVLLEPLPPAEAFLTVASNAFNYETLGETAFELVSRMVADCGCYALTYSRLPEAVTALDRLTRGTDG
jgi:HprK-related kinase A